MASFIFKQIQSNIFGKRPAPQVADRKEPYLNIDAFSLEEDTPNLAYNKRLKEAEKRFKQAQTKGAQQEKSKEPQERQSLFKNIFAGFGQTPHAQKAATAAGKMAQTTQKVAQAYGMDVETYKKEQARLLRSVHVKNNIAQERVEFEKHMQAQKERFEAAQSSAHKPAQAATEKAQDDIPVLTEKVTLHAQHEEISEPVAEETKTQYSKLSSVKKFLSQSFSNAKKYMDERAAEIRRERAGEPDPNTPDLNLKEYPSEIDKLLAYIDQENLPDYHIQNSQLDNEIPVEDKYYTGRDYVIKQINKLAVLADQTDIKLEANTHIVLLQTFNNRYGDDLDQSLAENPEFIETLNEELDLILTEPSSDEQEKIMNIRQANFKPGNHKAAEKIKTDNKSLSDDIFKQIGRERHKSYIEQSVDALKLDEAKQLSQPQKQQMQVFYLAEERDRILATENLPYQQQQANILDDSMAKVNKKFAQAIITGPQLPLAQIVANTNNKQLRSGYQAYTKHKDAIEKGIKPKEISVKMSEKQVEQKQQKTEQKAQVNTPKPAAEAKKPTQAEKPSKAYTQVYKDISADELALVPLEEETAQPEKKVTKNKEKPQQGNSKTQAKALQQQAEEMRQNRELKRKETTTKEKKPSLKNQLDQELETLDIYHKFFDQNFEGFEKREATFETAKHARYGEANNNVRSAVQSFNKALEANTKAQEVVTNRKEDPEAFKALQEKFGLATKEQIAQTAENPKAYRDAQLTAIDHVKSLNMKYVELIMQHKPEADEPPLEVQFNEFKEALEQEKDQQEREDVSPNR